MSTMVSPSISCEVDSLESISKQLARKATFECGVNRLTEMIQARCSDFNVNERHKVMAAVDRVATLLRTRHSNLAFWQAGRRLFRTTEVSAANIDVADLKKIRKHVELADAMLREMRVDEEEERAATRQDSGPVAPSPFLPRPPYSPLPAPPFEGQLTLPEPPASSGAGTGGAVGMARARGPAAHPAAAAASSGLSLPEALALLVNPEALAAATEAARFASMVGPPAAAAAAQPSAGPGQEGPPAAPDSEAAPAGVAALQGLLEALQPGVRLPPLEGPAESPATLELLSDALLQQAVEASAQAQQPPGAPPASKRAVAALPVWRVPPLKAAAAAGAPERAAPAAGAHDRPAATGLPQQCGPECSVCREAWQGGDEVRQMPCSHCFHTDCLAPWLAEHNSCPLCRYEMPTDDLAYESRKEREKEEEENRRGAANAVQEGQYMYM